MFLSLCKDAGSVTSFCELFVVSLGVFTLLTASPFKPQ